MEERPSSDHVPAAHYLCATARVLSASVPIAFYVQVHAVLLSIEMS